MASLYGFLPHPYLEEKNVISLAEGKKGKPNVYVFNIVSLCSPGWPLSPQLPWCWDYRWVYVFFSASISALESELKIPAIIASNDSTREAR